VIENKAGASKLGGSFGHGGSGDGIYHSVNGNLKISNSGIYRNKGGSSSASNGKGGSGGGIYSNVPTEVINSVVWGNQSGEANFREGGGLYVTSLYSRTLAMTNTTISSNYTGSDGGGMFINTVNADITATLKFGTFAVNNASCDGHSLYACVVNNTLVLGLAHTILTSLGNNYQF
jgi:hypothetical protein